MMQSQPVPNTECHWEFEPSLFIEYETAEGEFRCEADGVVLMYMGEDPQPHRVVVIECKLSRTSGAPKEISELYFPVLKKIWPQARFSGVVMFKNHSNIARKENYLTRRNWHSFYHLKKNEVYEMQLVDPIKAASSREMVNKRNRTEHRGVTVAVDIVL